MTISEITTASMIEDDCRILLERALRGKMICAFGEDGDGKHGRCDRAKWFTIRTVLISLECDDFDRPAILAATVYLYLSGYDCLDNGHIMSDKNFDIALVKLLKDAAIDPEVLLWPEDIDLQGDNFVTMTIDIPKLLDWA